MIDVGALFRFALRMCVIVALLCVGGALGLLVAWRWPLNFFGAMGLVGLGYVLGRVHEAEIAGRPALTIAPLPSAHARRRK